MKFQILNSENKVAGEIELSDQVFGVLPRKDILTRVVLWQLAKRRCGNHTVKDKSDVHGTTKKMYKQKGTGGARHGSKKAVQFRGGGIVFGPVLRSHEFDLQKKVRKLGLKMALSAKVREGNLLIVESFDIGETMKTKDFLKRFPVEKSALFIDSKKDERVFKSISNIVSYDYIPQIGANVYDILNKEKLIISADAVRELESRLV